MAALTVPAVPAPGMGTALDGLASQPINSRRPAAPTLPSFELPPPPFGLAGAAAPKYQTQHSNQPPLSHPPANVSVGNLLTPPATNQSGETGTISHSLPPSSGVSSDMPSAYWPGTTPYGAPGAGPGQWASGPNAAYSGRSSFSPSGLHRSGPVTSPPTTDGLSQPFEAPPMASFSQALPAPSTTLAPGPHSVTMGLYHSGHTASTASLPSNDPYNQKMHSLYASPSHQTGFSPIYTGPNPIGGHGGLGIHPGSRMPLQSPGGQPPLSFPRQPWPSYSLPAMSGPIMTNVHSPNSPMSMMGGMQSGILPGFNSGHIANTQHLYGAHPAAHHGMPGPTADRPFKCDQCPQSFNRNHDLKRHKRIHLAVKPFPCAHCDKSFSRKDALKRHILVKGCGKDGDSDALSNQTGTDGTIKGEGRSEDGSPMMNGRN
ncbi:uncharacterized protein N7496_007673 [Penicillium cataractarum]|uniref:C2H2-type domain-containing protein n=1 Tax=Penicillium cataractarum TaxID=2100454 RepID=A0A9W9V3U2_9EURO|nr:uncharacterized protein N7496_007673 [Penicillium cataractarum]KAJ5367913.1 hypothetical protein N7496_007673 [Penicillium cataractarum]